MKELALPRPIVNTDHVPVFLHVMSNLDAKPVFDTDDIEELGGEAELTFDTAGDFEYFCRHHPGDDRRRACRAGRPDPVTVTIVGGPPMAFSPADVTVGVGGTVRWINNSDFHHTVTSKQGAAMPTHCINGRGFVGNTPTIVGRSGQRIRWYVFNLDTSPNLAQLPPARDAVEVRRRSDRHPQHRAGRVVRRRDRDPAGAAADQGGGRGAGPGAPAARREALPPQGRLRVPLPRAPPHDERHGRPGARPPEPVADRRHGARDQPSNRACRSTMAANTCPDVDPHPCHGHGGGRWEEIPGAPEVAFMHSVLLPSTQRVLYWGYTRADQSRVWDYSTPAGTYMLPANQPADSPGLDLNTSNMWSAEHTDAGHGGGHCADPRRLLAGQGVRVRPRALTWTRVADTAATASMRRR